MVAGFQRKTLSGTTLFLIFLCFFLSFLARLVVALLMGREEETLEGLQSDGVGVWCSANDVAEDYCSLVQYMQSCRVDLL